MKKILLILIAISIISCKNDPKKLVNITENVVAIDPYLDLYGNWVGDFKPSKYDENASYISNNKINIVIKKIENNKVFGQSIVAGNIRNLEGELKKSNNSIKFLLKEPGDQKYDGKFQFEFSNDTLKGKWTANNKKIKVYERNYALSKQKFVYNPKLMLSKDVMNIDYTSPKIDSISYTDDTDHKTYYETEETYRQASNIVSKLNASTNLIKEKDIKNLKKIDLEILRNTIFARHGYSFKNEIARQFFDNVEWYIPISNDVSKQLTPTEKVNIALFERFEKYAKDNYMSFGR